MKKLLLLIATKVTIFGRPSQLRVALLSKRSLQNFHTSNPSLSTPIYSKHQWMRAIGLKSYPKTTNFSLRFVTDCPTYRCRHRYRHRCRHRCRYRCRYRCRHRCRHRCLPFFFCCPQLLLVVCFWALDIGLFLDSWAWALSYLFIKYLKEFIGLHGFISSLIMGFLLRDEGFEIYSSLTCN